MSEHFYIELKDFLIKLAGLIVFLPLGGFFVMKITETTVKAWSSNKTTKRWLASCGIFIFLAGISGWLR
jgi:hypothetical protein